MDQDDPATAGSARAASRWWYLILIAPFAAMLLPQTYNTSVPALAGLPFFYWYQLLWIIVTGLLTLAVYALVHRGRPGAGGGGAGS